MSLLLVDREVVVGWLVGWLAGWLVGWLCVTDCVIYFWIFGGFRVYTQKQTTETKQKPPHVHKQFSFQAHNVAHVQVVLLRLHPVIGGALGGFGVERAVLCVSTCAE